MHLSAEGEAWARNSGSPVELRSFKASRDWPFLRRASRRASKEATKRKPLSKALVLVERRGGGCGAELGEIRTVTAGSCEELTRRGLGQAPHTSGKAQHTVILAKPTLLTNAALPCETPRRTSACVIPDASNRY